jgi:PAS domain S-box-containing protein
MLYCLTHSAAWLFLLAGVGNLVLAGYLFRYGTRSSTISWFQMYAAAAGLFYLTVGFMVCATTPDLFRIWHDAYAAFVALLIALPIIFTLYFTYQQRVLDLFWVRLLLVGLPLVVLWMFWQTDFVHSRDFFERIAFFGYQYPSYGSWSNVVGFIIMLGYLLPILIVARYYRHIENSTKRQEVRLILAALLVGITPPVIFEGFLPTFFHAPSIPVGAPFSLVMNGMIFYAITRYGLRVFSLDHLSSDVLQVLPGGLVILDHTQTIQYVNEGAANLLGYKSGQLTGASLRKLFTTASAYGEFQTEVLAPLQKGSEVSGHETEFRTRHKQTLAVSVNAANVYYGKELINRLISFTDVSALKRTEAELEAAKSTMQRQVVERTRELFKAQAQLLASVRALPFGLAVVSRSGEMEFSNDLFGRLLGHPVPMATTKSSDELKRLSQAFQPDIDILALIKQAQTGREPLERTIMAGARYFRFLFMPILGAASEHSRESVLGTVFLVEDITEAKTLERSRDEFFSIASHELRTPLTAIRGNANMIMDYYHEQVKEPNLHDMVDDIHTASIRLINIVNDFLDTSRLELGKIRFDFKACYLPDILREVIRQFETAHAAPDVKLVLADLPDGQNLTVTADADRVRQIIFNLVGNAIHATKEGSITLTVAVEGSMARVAVTDTGKGIPASGQHLLFHKFQQASGNILTRDGTHGTGLGLYISRLLAEGMRGKLYLHHTEEGKGSTFVLELPLAPHLPKPSKA